MRDRPVSPHPASGSGRYRAYVAFTLLVPLLILALLEILLQAIPYGPDLGLFIEIPVNSVRYKGMNPRMSARYFFRTEFQPGSGPDLFLAEKLPGTVRVFCLGASTTVGYPYWYNAAFSSFLRQRLASVFPEKTIEVVNLGITATNSFTLLDIMGDVVRERPDAVVVYDGHNEFYGALGVASRESLGGSRWMIKAYLSLLHFKSFLLLRDGYGALAALFGGTGRGIDRSTMMERMAEGQLVPQTGPVYTRGIETFRDNLKEISRLCLERHTPLLVCTQVSNLRDLPPFASMHRPEIPDEKRAAFDRAMAWGDSVLASGDTSAALSAFGTAVSADPEFAAAHFRRASLLDARGRYDEAEAEYRLARDKDVVRFRASGDINALIREAPAGAIPVDIEAAFADVSPHRLIGSVRITEHLHPDDAGQFLIAGAVIDVMKAHGILCPGEEWTRRDTLPAGRLWEQRPVTPLDGRIAKRKTEILRAGWPFRTTATAVSAVDDRDTVGQIAELVVQSRWSWRRAHEAMLAMNAARGNVKGTEGEYRAILSQFPLDAPMRARFGAFLAVGGRTAEARKEFTASVSTQETGAACRGLGDLELQAGNMPEALLAYQKSLGYAQRPAEEADTRLMLALALLKSGDSPGAITQLRESLRLNPHDDRAKRLLEGLATR